jgi:hypothetical protein
MAYTSAVPLMRQGTVLIIVAGISALLAMLALAFLARMRADAEDGELLLSETRARVMFASALQYIAETSRIGWDNPATPEKEEAFGWLDIRTGTAGPLDRKGDPLFSADDPLTGIGTRWPAIRSHMICNTRLWTRPPTAISSRVATNPIQHDPNLPWAQLVGYSKLDPTPIASDFTQFLSGDDRPVAGTDAPCWFRVYRKAPAVFIVSCGGGSSGGYKNWAEVQNSPDADLWHSREEWEMARLNEPILFYEVAWSPAVNTTSTGWIYAGHYSIKPALISRPYVSNSDNEDQPNKRNQLGTFLYRQRLAREPDHW